MTETETASTISQDNFIKAIIREDLATGKNGNRVHTRFPPEPNGYLHIGHAKSICLNFGIAREFNGLCNLRFDDTNPSKEEDEYVESIKADVKWLGFDWQDRLFFASDYFEQIYQWAVQLIKNGKAYVDDLSAEEMRLYRGSLTEAGKESPHRNRSVEENLQLFEEMRAGKYNEGEKILRAKIDMAAPNMNLRDPALYRIMKQEHHRTGNQWCIYPMYDFAHGQSDSLEGITHSICTLEFEDHRPLYNWFLDALNIHHPRQVEFARLNITYTVMSKRKLLELVTKNLVNGWDDPRMPTLSGMRRRGYPAESIRNFCDKIGVAKKDSTVDIALLEHCIREELNKTSPRVLAVLNPLKVVITNYPENQTEEIDAINNSENPEMGSRKIPFSREIFIEKDDFMEEPVKKFFRLAPGKEVRLRYTYFITCQEVIKDANGEVIELRCTYDPATKTGYAPDERKVKGTIQWVDANSCINAEARIYDRLFTKENPEESADGGSYVDNLNPDSLKTISCLVEPTANNAVAGSRYQFERIGYFCADKDSTTDKMVFNLTVSLKESWKGN